jgi:hypothetical protein
MTVVENLLTVVNIEAAYQYNSTTVFGRLKGKKERKIKQRDVPARREDSVNWVIEMFSLTVILDLS